MLLKFVLADKLTLHEAKAFGVRDAPKSISDRVEWEPICNLQS